MRFSTSAVSAGITCVNGGRAQPERAQRAAVFVRRRSHRDPPQRTSSWAALDAGGKGAPGRAWASVPFRLRRGGPRSGEGAGPRGWRACAAFTPVARALRASRRALRRAPSQASPRSPRRTSATLGPRATIHPPRAPTASFGPKAARRTSAREPSLERDPPSRAICDGLEARSAGRASVAQKRPRFQCARGDSPAASAHAPRARD